MEIPTKTECCYIYEMLEAELLDLNHITLWAKLLIDEGGVSEKFIKDLSCSASIENVSLILLDYLDSKLTIADNLLQFHIGCLLLVYQRRLINWDLVLLLIERKLKNIPLLWCIDDFYKYKKIYTLDVNDLQSDKFDSPKDIMYWFHLAQVNFAPFNDAKQVYIDKIIDTMYEAFAYAKYPGDNNLRGSDLGYEPYLLEAEFKGKTKWQNLDSKFIDRAPDGLSSALSFFSDQAFCFYIPAYIVAFLKNELECADPLFHLTHGLADDSKAEKADNECTWFDYMTKRLSHLTPKQKDAIVMFLEYAKEQQENEFEKEDIEQALINYWLN